MPKKGTQFVPLKDARIAHLLRKCGYRLPNAAKALQVGLQPFELQGSGELDRVFAAMADSKIDALVVHDDQVLIGNAQAIATLAARQKLPSCGFLEFAAAGGLAAYGVNFVELFVIVVRCTSKSVVTFVFELSYV